MFRCRARDRERNQQALLAPDVREVERAKVVDLRGDRLARTPATMPTSSGRRRRQFARDNVVVVLELGEKRFGGHVRDGAQAREHALFLVGVMVGRGAIEVLEDGPGGGARIVVAAMLGQVALQAAERGELALDAPVARDQHPERIVEAGRQRVRERVRGHGRRRLLDAAFEL